MADSSKDAKEFYNEVSAEQVEKFNDVDVLIGYGSSENPEEYVNLLKGDALISKMPAVASGRIAVLGLSNPLAASANPSPLSIGWGIDKYFSLINEAAQK